jgi:hypothetical protein
MRALYTASRRRCKSRKYVASDGPRLDCDIAMCHLHFTEKALGINRRWEPGTFDVLGFPGAEQIGKYIDASRMPRRLL